MSKEKENMETVGYFVLKFVGEFLPFQLVGRTAVLVLLHELEITGLCMDRHCDTLS